MWEGDIGDIVDGNKMVFNFPIVKTIGRYVEVQLNGTNFFQLTEVVVIGHYV